MQIISATPKKQTHPCFYAQAKGKYGRIHLPVAGSCNIQCNYCRRDHDCLNENRPGVTKAVMSSSKALDHLSEKLVRMPHISVAAVAGPGDAFCDGETTIDLFERIRALYPELSLCVSSNGLNVLPFVDDLKKLDVGFVSLTVNAIDPKIGALLIRHANYKGHRYLGEDAAGLLIENQLESVRQLKKNGFIVKINTVVVPGINEDHVVFLARFMEKTGVDLMNLIPLIPVAGTRFEGIKAPAPSRVKLLRETAGRFVPQMYHCRRCRADAAGCL